MYIPNIYKNEDLQQVRSFIQENSFAILTSSVSGKPWATHLPLQLHGETELIGHIAKANPQWKHFSENEQVLCIFHGPHSYVSSSWYKEEEVPTWNYIAVHVYGKIEILSAEELLGHLENLIDTYEKELEHPLSIHDFSKSTLLQARGIVGFRIRIDDIQAAYKLSQGRQEDHPRIIEELGKKDDSGARQIARAMKSTPPEADQ